MRLFEMMDRLAPVANERVRPTPVDGDNAVGDSSGGVGLVSWQQNTAWALNHDFDGDGIVDALDNYLGPGAFDPHGL